MPLLFTPRAHRVALALVIVLSGFLLTQPPCAAQVDTIRANPDAVALRSIWSRRGNGAGNAVARLWDIDGDRRDEFAVQERVEGGLWRVHGFDSTGAARVQWQHVFPSPHAIITGDLLGTGRPVLVGVRERDTAILGTLYWLELFASDSGRIADTPFAVWHSRQPGVRLIAPRFQTADLDNDGADELIVAAPVIVRGDVVTRSGEIWIYRGGPAFSVDEPTVVVSDATDEGNNFEVSIGRIDADEFADLLGVTASQGRIWWGGPDIRTLARASDRSFAPPSFYVDLLDADGDRQADLLWYYAWLHLSGSGKDPRSRAYDQSDADRVFFGRGPTTFVLGALNDSAGRYDMFGLNSAMSDRLDLVFSGGLSGPDPWYDAWLPSDIRFTSSPLGDVDGNGWSDVLAGNERVDGGIAVVFGGGPYIPRDSMPASAIRDLPLEGHRDALTVWPLPATDRVHIAWRGDLGRTPDTFTVHDALGRLVARGTADHQRGEVIWNCADRSPGLYLLSIADRDGNVVAQTAIIKR